MLTIFSIPKPFRGNISIIQQNAINSWLKLVPQCEVILFGDDEGIEEIAAKLGVRHIPNVLKSEYGTPMLDHVFMQAEQNAKFDQLCYINSDMMILDDFVHVISHIGIKRALIVGRRTDVDLDYLWNFDDAHSLDRLKDLVTQNGRLQDPSGIDYFVFQRGILGKLPKFVVGRRGWDNWVIYHARVLKIPVIDITPVATLIHQNHNYNHVPFKRGGKWDGPESDENMNLIGKSIYLWSLNDANWIMTEKGLEKKPLTFREAICMLILKCEFMHNFIGNFYKQYKLMLMAKSKILRMR
jgi:hypothetical protein